MALSNVVVPGRINAYTICWYNGTDYKFDTYFTHEQMHDRLDQVLDFIESEDSPDNAHVVAWTTSDFSTDYQGE